VVIVAVGIAKTTAAAAAATAATAPTARLA
jgi:hypothetical protein